MMTEATETLEVEDEYDSAFQDAVDGKPEVVEEVEEEVATDETAEEDAEEESGETDLDSEEEPSEIEASEEAEPEGDVPLSSEQERIRELEHSVASGNGRVAALTRKLYKQSNPTPLEEGVAPTETATLKGGDKWAELQKEYPDIAGGTQERIHELESRVEDLLEKKLQPIRQAEEERYVESQIGIVGSMYPNWNETVNSEGFDLWIKDQPSPVQEMRKSYNAEDYIYLIKGYNTSRSDQVNSANAEKAESLKVSREKKLKSNVSVPNRGRSKPSGPPDDFEEAFAWYAEKD
jgi:hypothetical protein